MGIHLSMLGFSAWSSDTQWSCTPFEILGGFHNIILELEVNGELEVARVHQRSSRRQPGLGCVNKGTNTAQRLQV